MSRRARRGSVRRVALQLSTRPSPFQVLLLAGDDRLPSGPGREKVQASGSRLPRGRAGATVSPGSGRRADRPGSGKGAARGGREIDAQRSRRHARSREARIARRDPTVFDTMCGSHTFVRARMARKKISTTVYITPEQNERLKLLHDRTKVPVAEYIRQGIDLVLDKYRGALRPAHLEDLGAKK